MTPVWKTVLKWGVLTALLAYVVCMGEWSASQASRLKCRDIEVIVSGSSRADSVAREGVLQEINAMSTNLIGTRAVDINVRAIENHLSRLNNLEEVECAMGSNGDLRVYVETIHPEIRIFTSKGESYYINKAGKRIDANAEFFSDVPVVYGDFTAKFPATAVLPVTRFVAADPQLSSLITAIVARDADNILLVPRVRGHVINFGDTTRLERKKSALLTAYRQILPAKGWLTYDTISVKFRDQIVATRRDKTPSLHGADLSEDVDLEEATLPEIEPVTQQDVKPTPAGPTKPVKKPDTQQ